MTALCRRFGGNLNYYSGIEKIATKIFKIG